jgi:thioredoxin 1
VCIETTIVLASNGINALTKNKYSALSILIDGYNLKNVFKRNKTMALKLDNLSDTEFNAAIADGITLVDFWAPWCGPCKMQTPILTELASQIRGKVKIAKVNVDEATNVANQFSIQAIPTLILFKDGDEVRRFIGVQTKETLIEAIGANI